MARRTADSIFAGDIRLATRFSWPRIVASQLPLFSWIGELEMGWHLRLKRVVS